MPLNLPPVHEPDGLNDYPVLYWNHVGLEMNRITHSLGGPQGGPTMSSRALGLLHLAMHDAYFGWLGSTSPAPYLPATECPAPPAGADPAQANDALTAAAMHVLDKLYTNATGAGISLVARDKLTSMLTAMIRKYAPRIDVLSSAHGYGVAVANLVMKRLAVQPDEPGADQGRYEPRPGRSYFRDEPVNPLREVPLDPNDPSRGKRSRRVYHGPYYGATVKTFAAHDAAGHQLKPPPFDDDTLPHRATTAADKAEYKAALEEVKALGGAPGQHGTTRSPDGTVAGLYWAYDGANLIGTPPRLYNQIVREIAWERRNKADRPADAPGAPAAIKANTDVFVRLFALCNVAMADAGKFSWKEKYRWDFWRPLTGVREHDTTGNPIVDGDPFWLALGAPDTNTNRVAFKPPFPAYPSGHATFGAACFQMVRLYYKKDVAGFDPGKADDIGFKFISEELNGISRDLYAPHDPDLPLEDQPGTVRTCIERSFPSLWDAIFENAFSRVYLGVHWRFDAAAAADIKKPGTQENKAAKDIAYSDVWTAPRGNAGPFPTGGVPLGLGIANDIWKHGLTPPPDEQTPPPAPKVKQSNTTLG